MHIPEQSTLPLWHLVTFCDQILTLENMVPATMIFSTQRRRLDFFSQTDLVSDLSLAAYKLSDIVKVLHFSGT